MEYNKLLRTGGFTIVELLIVIVVIGILATITTVAYQGVQKKAKTAAASSVLNQASRKLALYKAANEKYPDNIADASINDTGDVLYEYVVDNSSSTFCIGATTKGVTYSTTTGSEPIAGSCPVLRLDAQQVASYPGTGDTWTDISGNGNNGTLTNGPTYSTSSGGVINFDGSNDFVAIPNNTNLSPESITVSAWMIINDTNSWMIVNKATGGTPGSYYIYGNNPNEVRWSIFGPTGARFDATIYESNDANWHFIVGTFDNESGDMELYKDGQLRASRTGADLGQNSNDVYIGRYTSGYYFGGSTGEITIYNKALNETEIEWLYNHQRNRYGA